MPHRDPIERVLVVTAHPDDVEFSVGGTVASFTNAGIEVTYCVITDGDTGGIDRAATRAEVAALRRREQVAAAAVLGVDDVRFLGYKDGELMVTLDLRRDISRVIRQVRPQARARPLARAQLAPRLRHAPGPPCRRGGWDLRDLPGRPHPLRAPEPVEGEGLTGWAVPEAWIFGTPTPNHWVDVTEHIDRQLAALREHHSQTDHMVDLVDSITGRRAAQAAEAGMPQGHLAEAFMTVDTV